MSPAFAFLLLVVAIVAIPILIGLLALVNRDTGAADEDEVADLRRRVEELESQSDDD